jgi:ribosome-associated translation inhibitor RaiA
MKTSINYKHVETAPQLERTVVRHLRKVSTLLKSYEPDLVQLHGDFEKHPRRTEYNFLVNLSLPTGTLHATGVGPDPVTSARFGFAELESQIKKHQSRLRKDYQWKRKRGRASERSPEALSAQRSGG